MLLRISGAISILVGVIIFLFFENYKGNVIPYPFLVWLGGLVFIIGGALLFRRGNRKLDKKDNADLNSQIEAFKRSNESIVVDFTDCEILSNNYVEEVLRNTARARAWDAMIDETRNTSRQQVNQSVIVWRKMIHNQEYRFVSPALAIDQTTLMFKLDAKKQTSLYYNRYNPSEYYFDLEFLCSKDHE